jgi:hypothetical protein
MFNFQDPNLVKNIFISVLRIRIPDPESDAFFDPWIWDPGWVKVEIRICDEHLGSYFLELRNSFLG